MSGILERLGIVRHTLKKDLQCFFLPWIAVMVLEMSLCRTHGDGLAGIWGVLWTVIQDPREVGALPWQRVAGLALFVVGLATMIAGQVTLWRNYSGFVVIKQDHQLVTHGIYRFTRNPIYLGALVVFAGLPLYARSVHGFLAMLAMIPIFRYRISLEEQMLAETFGEEYEAYRARTKRLIPFVY